MSALADSLISPSKYASAEINRRMTAEEKIHILREMVRIRAFEKKAEEAYQVKKAIAGFLHLYVGQEAIAVSTASLMGLHDHVITAYRCHGHALAVGMNMNECMAELYGKGTGCSKGKGGSMHFFAPDKNYWGGHGIVGGQTPLGLGIAYAMKYQGKKGACFTFLGDGAVNQGAFHESLNLAALWNIPVIYVIENNRYSMGTTQERSSAFRSCLAERADGYGIDWAQVENGSDVYEVRAALHTALERAHETCRPSVIEIATYRYYGHSIADAKHSSEDSYRCNGKAEIEAYKQEFDCVTRWRDHLIATDVMTQAQFKTMEAAAFDEGDAAMDFAENSAFPPPESIFDDVYWEVDNKTEAGATGRHFFND
jgi:pyruvate dehydrogenase E1 component alpha subunit